jgi:hypothetical protein
MTPMLWVLLLTTIIAVGELLSLAFGSFPKIR